MKTAESQTQQFLMFLAHQDKLTKLYQRIKSSQTQKQQLANKIEYLEFKIKAMEKSLFQQQFKNQRVQSSKNLVLIQDVIELEQELNKQKKQIRKQRSSNKNNDHKDSRKLHTSPTPLSRKQTQTVKLKDFKDMTLRTIKQQSQMSNESTPFSTIQLRPQKSSVLPLSNNHKTNTVKLKRNDEVEQMSQRIEQLEKLLAKQAKAKKILEVENRRLRKANQQFNVKCKRLQKLIDAREQLYNNIHQSMGPYNLSPFKAHGSHVPTEFNYDDKESLFQ